MADTVKVRWLYPPNWDGFLPDQGGFKRVVIQLTCMSDGGGETNVVKLNLSELRTPSGKVPTRTAIERVAYTIFGLTVKLEWDRTPNEIIAVLNAAGTVASDFRDYKRVGGLVDPGEPGGEGTGDILLSTTNADAGDSYDIVLTVRLKD